MLRSVTMHTGIKVEMSKAVKDEIVLSVEMTSIVCP